MLKNSKIFQKDSLKYKAFTLFEILIVTFIISLVYTMFVVNFKTSEKENIKIKTLKEYISKQKYKNHIRLICLQNEKHCRVYLDNNKKYDSLFLFKDNKEIIVYDFDLSDDLQETKFNEFYVDEYESKKVSLDMYFFSEGNNKPYLIDDGKRVIFFPTFKNILLFNDIENAKEFFISNKRSLLSIYKEKIRVVK